MEKAKLSGIFLGPLLHKPTREEAWINITQILRIKHCGNDSSWIVMINHDTFTVNIPLSELLEMLSSQQFSMMGQPLIIEQSQPVKQNVMNLNEAIKHCLEKSKECNKECSLEHFQLATWLSELRAYRKLAEDFSKFLGLCLINKDNFTIEERNLIKEILQK